MHMLDLLVLIVQLKEVKIQEIEVNVHLDINVDKLQQFLNHDQVAFIDL